MTETGIHYLDARAPDGMRLYAIGDVHGRHDLLAAMHRRIESELEYKPAADWRIIHLGDYVDRGPDSKGVIDFLIAAQKRDPRNLMLAGNHDIGFLDFLDTPDPDGLFMRYGGVQTALSYAAWRSADAPPVFGKASPRAHAHHWSRPCRRAMIGFLRRSLPFFVTLGDFFSSAMPASPGIAAEANPQDLIWIRDVFHNPGLYPKIVVRPHGAGGGGDGQPRQCRHAAWQSGHAHRARRRRPDKRILTIT